jgi:Tfp pilus assembly protein PilV
MKTRLAFSILEITVVILTIGILGVGAVKGKSIMRGAELKSAHSLTQVLQF